jgi:hypothetical protein
MGHYGFHRKGYELERFAVAVGVAHVSRCGVI